MKNSIIYKLAVLIAVPVTYFFIVSGFSSPEVATSPPSIQYDPKDFTNSIFNEEYGVLQNDPDFLLWNNLDKISDELHFNAVNWYNFWGDPLFGYHGMLLDEQQINLYKSKLDLVSAKPLKGYYEKCNFSYPMYGQRLVYEIHDGVPDYIDLNYGFVYQTVMQNVHTTNEGRTVLHPRPGINQAGYLCRDIYENFQHTDLFDFRQNDQGFWYIKPVMRIPTDIQTNTLVVTIEVVAFDNEVIKTIPIYSDNFKENGITYSGEYVSSYFGLPPNALRIEGDDEDDHLNQNRIDDMWNWGNPNSPACCHVDFRVYWHGDVEVWFDKMVVDDEIAKDVFDLHRYDDMIIQQAEEFTNYPSYYTFFTDETCISQVPCIKYVINKMRSVQGINPPPKFSVALTNYLNVRGLKNDNLSFKYFFDSLEVERVQMDAFQFIIYDGGYGALIPNVFPEYDARIPQNWFTTPYNYNNALQNRVFGDRNTIGPDHVEGSLVYQIAKIRHDSRQYSPGTLLIIQPQIQAEVYSPDEYNSYYTFGTREPTNEELRAEAMIALAHGAEGLCWFIYN